MCRIHREAELSVPVWTNAASTIEQKLFDAYYTLTRCSTIDWLNKYTIPSMWSLEKNFLILFSNRTYMTRILTVLAVARLSSDNISITRRTSCVSDSLPGWTPRSCMKKFAVHHGGNNCLMLITLLHVADTEQTNMALTVAIFSTGKFGRSAFFATCM